MKYASTHASSVKQTGMTLIELMVAMLLGLILLAGIMQIFLSSKQTYRLQSDLSRIQENGRFALHFLGSGIREAGYSGCYGGLSSGVENTLNTPTNLAWNLANVVEGFDNVAAADTHAGITNFIAGTDVLIVKGMYNGVAVNALSTTSQLTITEANNNFSPNELLLVTNCDQASLFQASAVTTASGITTIQHTTASITPGNSSASVSNLYGTNAEIGQLQTRMYYLSTGGNGRPALFEANLVVTGTTIALQGRELIQNVENLQFVYGEDTNGDRETDVYQDAGAVTNWNNVVSVRIALLLESEADNQISNARSYTFNTVTFYYDQDDPSGAGANRRFRRVFTGFAALRNRIL